MEPVNSLDWISSELLKNCGRCGGNFRAYEYQHGTANICMMCRAPKHARCHRELVLGHPLSPRESQIVELVADAKMNKEIAGRLGLSEGTVKTYMSGIFAKTGMSNRTQLAVWWIRKSDNPSKTV